MENCRGGPGELLARRLAGAVVSFRSGAVPSTTTRMAPTSPGSRRGRMLSFPTRPCAPRWPPTECCCRLQLVRFGPRRSLCLHTCCARWRPRERGIVSCIGLTLLLVVAAAVALLNGLQIYRMTVRVDAMESHMQASLRRLSADIVAVNTRIDNVLLAVARPGVATETTKD